MRFAIVIFILFSYLHINAQNRELIGKDFISLFLEKKEFQRALTYLNETAKTKINEIELKSSTESLENRLGKFSSFIAVNFENNSYYFYVAFEKNKLDIKLKFDSSNQIVSFQLLPHKSFDNSKNDFIIPNGNYPIIGTLQKPTLVNKNILTIFIHGSGPNDRDETIQENKPFKDIANGFFENGISSYRFDKKSLTYPTYFNNTNMDIDNEVCNDIYLIVDFFRNDSTFKDYKIFLVGHSLGGMLLPRIADSLKTKINGIIMLAAPAFKFEDVILSQYNYLFELKPNIELKNEIVKLNNNISYLHSSQFNLNSLSDSLPLKMPAIYWQSIIEYDQVLVAKRIKVPALIVQAERDYQVEIKNYIIWKKALKSKKNYSFKSYKNLNHMFLEGKGKSIPSEYLKKLNVPKYFIDDLSNWLLYNN
jgi:alpha-beta hydrolase superfamily lysophospholipase